MLSNILRLKSYFCLYYFRIVYLYQLLLALLFCIIFLFSNFFFELLKNIIILYLYFCLQNIEFFKSFKLIIVFKQKEFQQIYLSQFVQIDRRVKFWFQLLESTQFDDFNIRNRIETRVDFYFFKIDSTRFESIFDFNIRNRIELLRNRKLRYYVKNYYFKICVIIICYQNYNLLYYYIIITY